MSSYIEKHVSFGVDEYRGLWKLQFIHPFFHADSKQIVTVYLKASNTNYYESKYKGSEIVDAGPLLSKLIENLLPTIKSYPYRWELEGQKLDSYGYDFVSEMTNTSENVNVVELTNIANEVVQNYYQFKEEDKTAERIKDGYEVNRNGGMVELTITLEKAQWINQLSMDIFSVYPIELCKLLYQEDDLKFSAIYEVPFNKKYSSSSSLSILFPSIFAKKIILIVSQETYTLMSLNLNEVRINEKEDESILVTNLKNYMSSTYDEIWAQEEKDYQNQKINLTEKKEVKTDSEWRPEYKIAKERYDKEMLLYSQRLTEYEEAERKYNQEMKDYVKYQQELADWQRKWGV